MSQEQKKPFEEQSSQSLMQAFRCAGQGFVYTVLSQRNMKIHLVVAVLAIILGFVLSIDLVGWLAIVGCIFVVFAAECLNTALEAVVDLLSPGYSEAAGHAKDCAAAAVLVLAVMALVIAALVYGTALWKMV